MKKIFFLSAVLILTAVLFVSGQGCASGDCANGFGTFVFKNGDKYEGDFVNYHLDGYGILYNGSGDIYEGDFKNDQFNGYGKYLWKNGNYYIGDFKDGKRNGLGVFYYSKTTMDKGKWENGLFKEKAEFEERPVKNPYDICTEINKIIESSIDNFNAVKGDPISELLKDSYYCKAKLKKFTALEINTEKGFQANYYSGANATDASAKFDELLKIIADCASQGDIKYSVSENVSKAGKTVKYSVVSPTTDIRLLKTYLLVKKSSVNGMESVDLCIAVKK